jgi:hypothetical protein
MKTNTIAALTMLVLIVAFNRGFSQAVPNDSTKIPKSYWGSLGVGQSSLGAFAGKLDANAEFANRLLVTASFQGETNSILGGTQLASYNLLLGKIFKQRISMFTLSAGIGLVNVTTKSFNLFSTEPSVSTSQTGIGLPIVIQGYLVAGQTVGFGVSGYLNLNTVKTTAGITFSLAIGHLATHKN